MKRLGRTRALVATTTTTTNMTTTMTATTLLLRRDMSAGQGLTTEMHSNARALLLFANGDASAANHVLYPVQTLAYILMAETQTASHVFVCSCRGMDVHYTVPTSTTTHSFEGDAVLRPRPELVVGRAGWDTRKCKPRAKLHCFPTGAGESRVVCGRVMACHLQGGCTAVRLAGRLRGWSTPTSHTPSSRAAHAAPR